MRVWIFALTMVLAACAAGADPEVDLGPSPFPVERGEAPPPPRLSTQSAPPEGQGAGGIDFGQWRSAEPAAYASSFETQIRERFAGQNAAALRAGLEANGFACQNETRLDCRIEIMESQCAFDWYVVLERGARQPVAGFDRMCLGAR